MSVQRATEPRITVIMPARNEAANLREVIPRLPPQYEVILVDGHSVDGSIQAARAVRPSIRVVHQARQGKGNALVCGLAVASGDIVILFDADGSADPDEIPRFVAALQTGADYAKGSRFVPGGGSADITRFRHIGNWWLNLVANFLLGTHHTDLCYGYNAMWRDAVELLDLPFPWREDVDMEWGDGFEIEALLSCRIATGGLRVVEVPSVELCRIHGASNLKAVPDGLRVLRTLMVERFGRQGRERWELARARRVDQTALVGRMPDAA